MTLICLLWGKEPVKVSERGESRAKALPRGHWNPSVLPKAAKKSRKAITHFLETGSVIVSRYQSKLQDKAKRSEGLSWDFKTYFSAQVVLAVSTIWLKELLHWHWCHCPPWLDRATPAPSSTSAASDCPHPPLTEERFKFKAELKQPLWFLSRSLWNEKDVSAQKMIQFQ